MVRVAFIIGTGGFLGSISRYGISRLFENNSPVNFPFGTFIVNILGCLVVGILYGITEKGNNINEEWRLFLTVGFCGAFTTFSAFVNENFQFLKETEFLSTMLYTGLSVMLGIGAVYLGNMATKLF